MSARGLRQGWPCVGKGDLDPRRLKEWPYVDVLSESANNAIRLLLGWFALITDRFPPVSLILSYWMLGAFFMAMKRFAEYRSIGDPVVAAAYRRSFGRTPPRCGFSGRGQGTRHRPC
jgi:hypothetical protein